ncbi:hypothetical protein [Tatumella saanichensis]|uniref:hypothetical protein n=1 Tax=Tatumella saanichensis TaxID=480813 RepID=UPI0004B4C7BB|nr:hypothetical protein [Tatumella saanichensis]
MSIVTAERRLPQLRVLPVTGGKAPAIYCYAVMVHGKWVPVNHSFAEWAMGDVASLNKQEAVCGRRDH